MNLKVKEIMKNVRNKVFVIMLLIQELCNLNKYIIINNKKGYIYTIITYKTIIK